PRLNSPSMRALVVVLALCNTITALGWLVLEWSALPFTASLAASGLVIWRLFRHVADVLEPVEEMGRDLFLLSGLLGRLEHASFTTPLLRSLHAMVLVEGTPASYQIGKLAGLVDWLNSIRNQFFLPLALLLLWRTQLAFAVEAWRRHSGP